MSLFVFSHQSIFSSPAGIAGIAVVGAVSICKHEKKLMFTHLNNVRLTCYLDAAYKMLAGNSPDQEANLRDKNARLTRPDLQGQSDVHNKLAAEQNPKKPN